MAVAFDAVGPSAAGTIAAATPLTWSHTCTGSDRALLVGVSVGQLPVGGLTLTVTYNSVAMTQLGTVASNNNTDGYVVLFGLLAPASGANTVSVGWTGGTPHHVIGGSVSLTGVASFGTAVTAFGASATPAVTVSGTTAGNMVVDVVCAAVAVGASTQTKRWGLTSDTTNAACNAAQATAAAGGSVTMQYSITSDWWGIVAVEAVAAAGGPPPTPPLSVRPLTSGRRWR